jgi:hypothetical protein
MCPCARTKLSYQLPVEWNSTISTRPTVTSLPPKRRFQRSWGSECTIQTGRFLCSFWVPEAKSDIFVILKSSTTLWCQDVAPSLHFFFSFCVVACIVYVLFPKLYNSLYNTPTKFKEQTRTWLNWRAIDRTTITTEILKKHQDSRRRRRKKKSHKRATNPFNLSYFHRL